MKYIITIFILLTALIQPAFAGKGKPGTHMDRRGQYMDRMLNDLNLNSDQTAAVRQILDEQHTKMRKEMESIREQARPKMEALHEETRQRLSSVLSKEQLQTFDKNMEKRRNRMREHRNRFRSRKDHNEDN